MQCKLEKLLVDKYTYTLTLYTFVATTWQVIISISCLNSCTTSHTKKREVKRFWLKKQSRYATYLKATMVESQAPCPAISHTCSFSNPLETFVSVWKSKLEVWLNLLGTWNQWYFFFQQIFYCFFNKKIMKILDIYIPWVNSTNFSF
jgi:hypothetical protein